MKKKMLSSVFLFLYILNIVFVSGVFGSEIVEIVICNEIDFDTGVPIEVSSIFFNYVSDIYSWVRFSDITSGQSLRFIWSSPGGVIIADNEVTTVSSKTDYWDQFYIKGYFPEQDPGEWSVHIYVNGILQKSEYFTIINYEKLILENELAILAVERLSEQLAELNANYAIVNSSIVSYITEITQLRAKYDEIVEEYSTIQEGYNVTKNDLQELLIEYDNFQSDYNTLSGEYESLSEELSTTKKSLNNTRTLLYGSSGLALILLIVSVYLVNKGRGS